MRQSLRRKDAAARYFRHDSNASGAIRTSPRASKPFKATTQREQFLQTEHAQEIHLSRSLGKMRGGGQGEPGGVASGQLLVTAHCSLPTFSQPLCRSNHQLLHGVAGVVL